MDRDKISFSKLSGSGNDFIIIDNRDNIIKKRGLPLFVKNICRDRFSIGADGVILIESSSKADLKWRIFNSDGSEAEMCGNGMRCSARFAYMKGISKEKMTFETVAGIFNAEIKEKNVKVKFRDPHDIRLDMAILIEDDVCNGHSINTGVPHLVYFVDDVDKTDVVKIGRITRYHELFKPAGTNVNFITVMDRENISIRTYERGVEDETLSCGSGSVASALIAALFNKVVSPVIISTEGGERLIVYFNHDGDRLSDIYLEGDARMIYDGEMYEGAWMK
ncbi:MAG: diaminopimelate epimerase [Nitrospirota bacterium]